MKFSLKQLAVFEAICRTGNVSHAADELALTQSATSMALAQLEKMLGKPLFERQSKRMALTHWGQWLRPRANKILFDARQIELGFADQEIVAGELRVAVSQTAAEHLFPQVITNLDANFPELRIQMEVMNTAEVIDAVREFHYDLGVIEGRCDDSRLTQEVWVHDVLSIVSSINHPYAKFKHISYSQLEQARWVLREHGSGIRAIFESAIHGHIDDLDVWREYEQVNVITSLVASSSYLTCLPRFDVEELIAQKELTELNVPTLNMERPMSFIWRADAFDNPLRTCVIQEAKRVAKYR